MPANVYSTMATPKDMQCSIPHFPRPTNGPCFLDPAAIELCWQSHLPPAAAWARALNLPRLLAQDSDDHSDALNTIGDAVFATADLIDSWSDSRSIPFSIFSLRTSFLPEISEFPLLHILHAIPHSASASTLGFLWIPLCIPHHSIYLSKKKEEKKQQSRQGEVVQINLKFRFHSHCP